MALSLTFTHKDQSIDFSQGGTVGSAAKCDLVIPGLDPVHVVVELDGHRHVYSYANSTGRKKRLRDGDTLWLANHEIDVSLVVSAFSIEDFTNSDAKVIESAKRFVLRYKPKGAIPELVKLLQQEPSDVDPFILRESRKAIYEILEDASDLSTKAVIEDGLLIHGETAAGQAYLNISTRLPAADVVALLSNESEHWSMLTRVVASVLSNTDANRDLITSLLGSEQSHITQNAIYTLAHMGAEESADQLSALAQENKTVGEAVEFALACFLIKRLKESRESPESALLALRHKRPDVVIAAIEWIASNAEDNYENEIIALIDHPDQSVRETAAQALGKFDHNGLFNRLSEKVNVFSFDGALKTAELITRLVTPQDVEAIKAAIEKAQWPQVRSQLIVALRKVSPEEAELLEPSVKSIEWLANDTNEEGVSGKAYSVEPDSNETSSVAHDPRQVEPVSAPLSAPEKLANIDARLIHEIFFVTDRRRRRLRNLYVDFSGKRATDLMFGSVSVSVPAGPNHVIGRIERPKFWKLQFREQAKKHFMLVSSELLDFEAFRKRAAAHIDPARAQALLFIHGYNVSFRDAIFRTAQLTHDLNFKGPAVTYSWPSQGKALGYLTDANNVEWTKPHLKRTIELLRNDLGVDEVHIIAHSMGNRALVSVLKELSGTSAEGQVILAAPDVDQQVFAELAGAFADSVTRVTLYASATDRALSTSKTIQGGYPRAGDTGESIVVLPGVDTVDATHVSTSFLGHSYIGDERVLVKDISDLIYRNLSPEERFGIIAVNSGIGRYWRFLP